MSFIIYDNYGNIMAPACGLALGTLRIYFLLLVRTILKELAAYFFISFLSAGGSDLRVELVFQEMVIDPSILQSLDRSSVQNRVNATPPDRKASLLSYKN